MTSQDYAIGVVIPTYNRAELLRAALSSVLGQTLLPEEVVVVDDGSTDHTADVVAEASKAAKAAGAHTNVIFIPGPHVNRRGEARNRGAGATTTPLIAFLDSDDLWKPERLEKQIAALRIDPRAGFAFCNVQRFDEEGPVGLPGLDPGRDFNGNILGDILEEPRAISSTLIVRREAFEQVGEFSDIRANEDYELTLRLALKYRASYVPEVLVLMREHGGRTSRAQKEMPLLDYVHIVQGFMAGHPEIPRQARAGGTRGVANVHFKLAKLYLQYGDKVRARRHLYALLRMRPWDRRALPAYVQSWLR